jgi:hypothetical protein
MRDAVAQELLYFRDDDHWNVRGYALAARLIADRMPPRGAANGAREIGKTGNEEQSLR